MTVVGTCLTAVGWRASMNRPVVLLSIAVGFLAGCGSTAPSTAPTQSALGGKVQFQSDGRPSTTEVSLVVDGSNVSGTAVTTFGQGTTHKVHLECAARNGDTWALGGKTEETKVPGERAGDWSAVIVKDGTPQRIGIWVSDDPSNGADCDAWLAAIDVATIDAENFDPVESGALVPPN
jgi:hypothetical protein